MYGEGLLSNDGHKEAVDLKQMVTCKTVTEGMSVTFLVDSNFKCTNGDGELLDSGDITADYVNPP